MEVAVALVIGGLFLVLIGILFKLPIKKKRTDADKVLACIKQAMEEHPTLRVGQLIGNVLGTDCAQLYYIEDVELLRVLENAYGM